jgi:hypothetical protein
MILLNTHVQESGVLQDSHIEVTRELHVLQAHLLHYQSLLTNFRVSVSFIEKTPNPAMESEDLEQREASRELLEKESENLLGEIERLEKRREMLSSRLKNSTDLAFATVNIEDSRQTRTLTEATVRDSAAMKQVPFSSHANSAPGTNKLHSDLVSDNGVPTGKLDSCECRPRPCRIYLTHISLVCLRDERQRDQPRVSRDVRSLCRDHSFTHAPHSLYRHHASAA